MSFPELAAFMMERREQIVSLTGQHLMLVGMSTLTAILIGVPMGVLI